MLQVIKLKNYLIIIFKVVRSVGLVLTTIYGLFSVNITYALGLRSLRYHDTMGNAHVPVYSPDGPALFISTIKQPLALQASWGNTQGTVFSSHEYTQTIWCIF